MATDWSIVVASSDPQPDGWRTKVAAWTAARAAELWSDAELILSDPRADPSMPFHHAEALNEGVRRASGKLVVLMDADTFVAYDAMRPALEIARAGGWALCRWYAQLNLKTSQSIVAGPADRPGPQDTLRGEKFTVWVGDSVSWAGFVVVSREHFLDVRGYDERLSGWAPDDIGLGLTLNALVAPVTRIEHTVWHLWHEPSYEREQGWTDEKHAVKNAYLASEGHPVVLRGLVSEKRDLR